THDRRLQRGHHCSHGLSRPALRGFLLVNRAALPEHEHQPARPGRSPRVPLGPWVDSHAGGPHNGIERTEPSHALRIPLRPHRRRPGSRGNALLLPSPRHRGTRYQGLPARRTRRDADRDADFVGELRTEFHSELAAVRVEMSGLRAEMHRMARTTQAWIVTTGIAMAGLTLAIARFG